MERLTLDANALSITRRKVRAALATREQDFGYRPAELHAKAMKHGAAGGTGHQQTRQDPCRTELRGGFQTGWEILRNISIDFNLPRTAEVGERFKALVLELVNDTTPALANAIVLTRGRSTEVDGQSDVTALLEEVVPEVEADIDLFISSTARSGREIFTTERLAPDQRKLFLSHAAVDAPQANFLKEEIERRMRGVSIFC